jgi:hypothetical protein
MKFAGKAWKLSPSDLTFLYEECPRCFWMKVAGGLPRPRAPFPKIFALLDSQMKAYFLNKRTEDMSRDVKPGTVLFGDRWVRSGPLFIPGHATPVLLQGRFDTAFAFDDGTFGLVDFKTADPKSDHIALYARQLHAYALAAENSAPGSLGLNPVTQMGLLCVEPTGVVQVNGGIAYNGTPKWMEVEREDQMFYSFLSDVLDCLARTSPPDPDPNCAFCSYVTDGALCLLASTQDKNMG